MKTRYQYALLFGVPGLLVAVVGALWAVAMAAGVAWLYLFGDDPWPAAAEPVLIILFATVFLATWGFALVWGYRIGKAREPAAGLGRRHLLFSVGLTLVLLMVMVGHQVRVGHLGPSSASMLCMDYCRDLGYDASGLSPRQTGAQICSCYDGGEVTVQTDLESLGEAAD